MTKRGELILEHLDDFMKQPESEAEMYR